jgi:hypothetical protein
MSNNTLEAQQARLCEYERNRRMRRIPLARFNLTSPYSNLTTGISTGITQQQLNMRRKVEILKYASNQMSSQTNNLTQKQKWSRLVTQPLRQNTTRNLVSQCPNDAQLRVPTSSSGVPGPVIYLWEDPNVPLYNYVITRTYAYNIPNPNNYWDTTVNTNVGILNGRRSTVFTISILKSINKPLYSYTVTIPIGLHVEGRLNDTVSTIPNDTFTISLSDPKMRIKQNGAYILNTESHPISTTTNITDFHLSFNLSSNMDVSNRNFTATQYVGTLTFSGIELLASPIYTFDFELGLNIITNNIDSIWNNFGSSFLCYAYANITKDVIATSNCITDPTTLVNEIDPPNLYGV